MQAMEDLKLNVRPLDTSATFKAQAYAALKKAVTEMDIYDHPGRIRLDERDLCAALGVSRTPIREALNLLEQEGLVRSQPRQGVFVVKKTKREILESITVWGALESTAARLATERATNEEIAALRRLFREFDGDRPAEHLNEYSDANIAFHQTIIRLGKCQLIVDITENLFIHVRAIRKMTIKQDNRAERSIADHFAIIEAIEQRDGERAERLVREHTMGLAAHVEEYCDFLD
jgi:DNA-binding GntR family transcriptional regulator